MSLVPATIRRLLARRAAVTPTIRLDYELGDAGEGGCDGEAEGRDEARYPA